MRNGKCFRCHHSVVVGWILFIASELVPATLVFALILLCRVPTNTGPLNTFLFFSQIISVITLKNLRLFEFNHGGISLLSHNLEAIGVFYGFWFDPVDMFYNNWCITENISAIQVVVLQYLSTFYISFLIVVVSVCIKLHYKGCRLLKCLCRPFQTCMKKLAIKWDPLNHTVNSYATFITLIYTKVLYTSLTLITPSKVYNQSGELPFKVMSYNSSIHFLS